MVETTMQEVVVVAENQEQDMERQIGVLQKEASVTVINTDVDYIAAAEFVKDVKRMQKQVKEYWEPLRVSAKKTYDDVLAKKKQMLEPLTGAEKILKGKMAAYHDEKERKRKEREAALRRLAEQEMERKLAEAAEYADKGDEEAAEYALAEAEVMEDISATAAPTVKKTKTKGVSTSKAWKIVSIDSRVVPDTVNGVEIRPVNESAVMRLIRESNGTVQIPGIKYEETVSISVRA